MSGQLGGQLAARPLHFILALDVSGSMAADGKIQALNVAIREAIPPLQEAAQSNPGAQVLVRALTVASGVRWVVPTPTPIEQFRWSDVQVEPRGVTELGLALRELAAQMRALESAGRGFAPVIVLVSDGQPTDTMSPTFRVGLEELRGTVWGEKAVRVAIGVGRDASLDTLGTFMGKGELQPLQADSPRQLADLVRFVSTVAVQVASRPANGGDGMWSDATLPAPDDSPVW